MFIVVAIVIFGIFVSLSYTLFGKTLQPQIVSIFTDATEQVNEKLEIGTVVPVTNIYTLERSGSLVKGEQTVNSIVFSSKGTDYYGDGIYISSKDLVPQKNYKLSYDIAVLDGTLSKLGGHIAVTKPNNIKTLINGVDANILAGYEVSYRNSIPYAFKTNVKTHIDVEFKTDKIVKNTSGNNEFIEFDPTDHNDMNIYIQPDRAVTETNPYKVKIENIQFIQI